MSEVAPRLDPSSHRLPAREEMLRATLERDAAYDGVFYTAVRTTGIFCRPTCPARKPDPNNVSFFGRAHEALVAGYRPCKRCRPLLPAGLPPDWLLGLLRAVEAEPARRWKDADLRARGWAPERVRRWFLAQHGVTFQAYQRCRRLGQALGRIRRGSDVTTSAFDCGYASLSGFGEAFRKLFGASPTSARDARQLVVTRVATPLGAMVAIAGDDALYLLEFADRRMLATQLQRLRLRTDATIVPGTNAIVARLGEELTEYFRGERSAFSVPLALPGSEFQQQVWRALLEIPCGQTVSYGELARRLGRAGSARAVARANGDNRIAILVPCHRVIAADGSLSGYGGSVWRKQRLLDLERLAAPLPTGTS